MTTGLASLPIAHRAPLVAGLAVLLVGLAVGQAALSALGREQARQAARLGQVYLDGLSAAVLPAIRAGDAAALHAALERAMGFQKGLRERRLVVAAPDGAPLAEVGIGPAPQVPPPLAHGALGPAWEFTPDGMAAWAQRPLVDGSGPAAIVAAKLDFSEIIEQRRAAKLELVALALGLAVAGAGSAAFAARRTVRPILGVVGALRQAATGRFEPIPEAELPLPRTEAGRLGRAFNVMAECLAERERLATRLAERECAAQLGRLVATLAHEVRNPLAGMLTAVETARDFGEDRAEREEALDLLDRGLRQVEAVVCSTLALYRNDGPPRPLAPADLDDLRTLVEPEARRRGVALDWSAALPGSFSTDALAARRALLNLLLNAVAATPPGARVTMEAQGEPDGGLAFAVSDEGPGLPPEARRRLLRTKPGPAEEDGPAVPGIGLDVVRHLADRLDGRLAVESGPDGRGTRVTLRLPSPGGTENQKRATEVPA